MDDDEDYNEGRRSQTSSINTKLPNGVYKLEKIRHTLQLNETLEATIKWHDTESLPINEYNIKKLLDMVFLFIFQMKECSRYATMTKESAISHHFPC